MSEPLTFGHLTEGEVDLITAVRMLSPYEKIEIKLSRDTNLTPVVTITKTTRFDLR